MDAKLAQYWNSIQRCIFPEIENEVGAFTSKHHEIMVVLDMVQFERFIYDPALPSGRGRPRKSRTALAKAFCAKAILNLPSTEALIDRLRADIVLRRICGFENVNRLPCPATFSNAFEEFSSASLLDSIHAQMVMDNFKDRVCTGVPVSASTAL